MGHRAGSVLLILGLGASTLELNRAAAQGADDKAAGTKGVVAVTPSLRMDLDKREVILDAEVVLREGALELLLCPRRTKEHESILAADVAPRSFQLALLGVGAEPGAPAQFEPKFKPATGQRIAVWIEHEVEGKQERIDARQWIRQLDPMGGAAKPMTADFIFAGSRFIKIPGERRARWLGDDGDLVCVANFPGAVIDIAERSDNANEALLYEAWTERIPPKGTKVRVIFSPEPRAKDPS